MSGRFITIVAVAVAHRLEPEAGAPALKFGAETLC